MNYLKIYKNDGTLQCEPGIKPRSVDEDQRFLDGLEVQVIGRGRHERLPIMVPALCGAPTGWANVFDIDGDRISRTKLLELSRNEFRIWHFAGNVDDARGAGDGDPFLASLSLASNMLGHTVPDRLKETIGYVVRVYRIGDAITDDYQANRLNLETDAH